MIRLIIMIAAGYGIYRSLKSWAVPNQSRQMGNQDRDQIEDVMVKDPVCQVYLPQREGHMWRYKGDTFYFCSTECLEKFKKEKTG
ncbi:MAG: hypothetical protein DSY90_06230 [Deltaproteobacteria bacterium]|nr:MAG: hypothetical protein DSY90_06230 [Deltaproteobacteria bacterium]